MAIPLNINGAVFEYPENFDENWGVNATGWAQAVTNGMLQRAGGNFPLTADANFGASFGLVSLYYKSRSANIATTGTVRLASADPGIVFRNNANSGNLILTTNASDNLLFNGLTVGTGGGNVNTGTANQLAYYPSSTNSVSGLTLITANRALASDSNGLPVASTATATALAFVDATSSIQTQINTKAPTASPTFTGTVTIPNGTTSATAAAFGQVQYAFQNAIQAIDTGTTTATTGAFQNTSLVATITPTSATSRIKITVNGAIAGVGSIGYVGVATGGSTFTGALAEINGNTTAPVGFSYIHSPASTSATVYTVTVKKGGSSNPIWNPDGINCVIILEELR